MTHSHLDTALKSLGIQAKWQDAAAHFAVPGPQGSRIELRADYDQGIFRVQALEPFPPQTHAQHLSDCVAMGAAWGLGQVYLDPAEHRFVLAVGLPIPEPVPPAGC